MIISIQRVKGLGVFGDFTAAKDLPPFARLNVIYGENGSGKTTLSRLFCALGKGEHPEYPDLDYTLSTENGPLKSGQQFGRKVRVFNSEYIDENIGQFDGPIKHILIVGHENKTLAAEMRAEQEIHAARTREIEAAVSEAAKLEVARGKVFSKIAATISEATSGSKTRNYRKQNAEAAFAKQADPVMLDGSALESHRGTVRQEQMDPVAPFSEPTVSQESGAPERLGVAVASAMSVANLLTQRSAQSTALERLAASPDVAQWVEAGLHLHTKIASSTCEFCDRPLPSDRLARLAEHFSVEDQKLKVEAEGLLARIGVLHAAAGEIALPDRAALYTELRSDFDAGLAKLRAEQTLMVAALDNARAVLSEKLTLRTTSYSKALEFDEEAFSTAISMVAKVLERQAEKTAAFDIEKGKAADAIEAHYLGTIASEIAELDAKIAVEKAKEAKLIAGAPDLDDPRGLKELAISIAEKQAKVSSAHAGGAELTEHLKKFLGRTDLRFESGAEGYAVLRRNKPAKRLSEGEKTAIAFIHFIVQLGDQDFNSAEGVVVIDDPISSLDASAIYQAFAFLKNAVKESKQIFILTHNFEFLKLLLPWGKHGFKKKAEYFMIVCSEGENSRDADIKPLDKLLVRHSSEYQYLFKVLYEFKSDGTIMSCYNIPNMARKVLETFLEFHVPSNDDIYVRLDNLKFDQHKKTAIYKFANDQSHSTGKGFDPALVSETQKNIKFLLEMIEAVAPEHYSGLVSISA